MDTAGKNYAEPVVDDAGAGAEAANAARKSTGKKKKSVNKEYELCADESERKLRLSVGVWRALYPTITPNAASSESPPPPPMESFFG